MSKNLIIKLILANIAVLLLLMSMSNCLVHACNYNETTGTFTCSDKICDDDALSIAKRVIVKGALSEAAIAKVRSNKRLVKLDVGDMSNFTAGDIADLYPVLAKGNVAMAAILFSYENYKSSYGNDGTLLYRRVISQKCPEIKYLRSCATVVSAAIDAAGVADYASAGTAGLVTYFENSPRWVNMGKLSSKEVRPGDIIFIDRKSHQKQYESGKMHDSESDADVVAEGSSGASSYVKNETTENSEAADASEDYDFDDSYDESDSDETYDEYDSDETDEEYDDSVADDDEEYVYEGGYDSTGHKNYEDQDPTGSSEEVFCPDQDGDGEVNDWEAEYWRCYWARVKPGIETPPYDYYYTWKAEAKSAKELRAAKAAEAAKKKKQKAKAAQAKVVKAKTAKTTSAQAKKAKTTSNVKINSKNNKVVHDHIFIWTGNALIKKVFPNSNGNIVSGSYTENYAKARSAAISRYDFTGDYRIYRYIPN